MSKQSSSELGVSHKNLDKDNLADDLQDGIAGDRATESNDEEAMTAAIVSEAEQDTIFVQSGSEAESSEKGARRVRRSTSTPDVQVSDFGITAVEILSEASTRAAKEMALLTPKRRLEFRIDRRQNKPPNFNNANTKTAYSEGAIAFIMGTERPDKCEKCARGNGRFALCVTCTDPDGTKYFKGACANCRWVGQPNKCTFHSNYQSPQAIPKKPMKKSVKKGRKRAVSVDSEEVEEELDLEDNESDSEFEDSMETEDVVEEEVIDERPVEQEDGPVAEPEEPADQEAELEESIDEDAEGYDPTTHPDYDPLPYPNGAWSHRNWFYPRGGMVFWPGMDEQLRRQHSHICYRHGWPVPDGY